MAQTEGQRKLIRAVKSCKPEAPWSLLPQITPYNASKHQYALRSGTMPTTVKLYQPILKAAALYGAEEYTQNSGISFRLVEKRTASSYETIMEAHMPDGTSFLVVAKKNSLQVSSVDPDGASLPVLAFNDMGTDALTYIVMALLPHILAVDKDEGSEKISHAINDLCTELNQSLGLQANWPDAASIPEIASDSSYFLDAVVSVLEKMEIECCPKGSAVPFEVADRYFSSPDSTTGALIAENLAYGWTPIIVQASGVAKKFVSSTVTIGDAKMQFANFSAHRNWSAQERLMIPEFDDSVPVMPETLRIAKRIADTKADKNPVCNMMWRGVTSYGKSTGIEQLACILQMPLLRMTCDPDMETQDFKSQFVPDASTEGILLNMENVVSGNASDASRKAQPPYFEDAMARISIMDETARAELLDAPAFFNLAMMDPDSASQQLLGKTATMEVEDLVWLYSEVSNAIRTAPLEAKLAAFEAANKSDSAPNDGRPSFVHIVSDYVKAMVNGYIIEIQEASRIRKAGVLVGLNEFNRPGARIPLMNGYSARRHKDALCIITDNVGYTSCRPIDPSVIRRMGFVIDSYELTKEELLDRVKRNTGVTDASILDRAYALWECVKNYCAQNSITEGCVSATELECLVQAVKYDGVDSFDYNLDDCVISKATSSVEDQRDIRTACQVLLAGF